MKGLRALDEAASKLQLTEMRNAPEIFQRAIIDFSALG